MKGRVFLGKSLGCLVGLLLVVILVLGSFGPAQAAAGAKPFKWPPVFRIGTSGTETTSFASTNGWAPKLEGSGKDISVVWAEYDLGAGPLFLGAEAGSRHRWECTGYTGRQRSAQVCSAYRRKGFRA